MEAEAEAEAVEAALKLTASTSLLPTLPSTLFQPPPLFLPPRSPLTPVTLLPTHSAS